MSAIINKEAYIYLDKVSQAIETLALINLLTTSDCYNLWMSALDTLRVKQIDYNRYTLNKGIEL